MTGWQEWDYFAPNLHQDLNGTVCSYLVLILLFRCSGLHMNRYLIKESRSSIRRRRVNSLALLSMFVTVSKIKPQGPTCFGAFLLLIAMGTLKPGFLAIESSHVWLLGGISWHIMRQEVLIWSCSRLAYLILDIIRDVDQNQTFPLLDQFGLYMFRFPFLCDFYLNLKQYELWNWFLLFLVPSTISFNSQCKLRLNCQLKTGRSLFQLLAILIRLISGWKSCYFLISCLVRTITIWDFVLKEWRSQTSFSPSFSSSTNKTLLVIYFGVQCIFG